MKLSGLASLVAVTVALSAAGIGCEDDVPPPRRDAAGGTGGRDASADTGSGGTGGGAVDAASDRMRDTAPAPSPDGGAADGPAGDAPAVDAPAVDAPAVDAPAVDAAPDAGVDAAAADTAPDTAVDTLPADAATDGVIVSSSCAMVNCPAMFDITNTCDGDEQECSLQVAQADPEIRHICFENGVRKISSTTVNGVLLEVRKPDGAPCYTLEIDEPDDGPDTWVFKAPGGAEIGRATVTPGDDGTTVLFKCPTNGQVYDISGVGCAGMEGDGDDCDDEACVIQ